MIKRFKKFNESSNLDLIEIISEEEYSSYSDRQKEYDFEKISDIIKEQYNKLKEYVGNIFNRTEIVPKSMYIETYFGTTISNEMSLLIKYIDDDYFLVDFFVNDSDIDLYLKVDSIEGLNLVADFIIKNSEK